MCFERIPYGQYPEGFWIIYYNSIPVRVFYINNVFWLALTDVCNVAGLSSASSVAQRLDEYEKMTLSLTSSHSKQRGGAQRLLLINEPGLYHLLFTSDKPEAESFRHWITFDVLHSIRRNGGYIMGQNAVDADELATAALQVSRNILAERDQRIQNLCLDNEAKAALLREWQPKARYYDAMLQNPKRLTTTMIATEYGWSPQRLNNYLQEHGVQYKRNDTWVLCKPYADKEYTYPQTSSHNFKRRIYWTQEGRAFLHDFLLRMDGILPLYERPRVPMDMDNPMLY